MEFGIKKEEETRWKPKLAKHGLYSEFLYDILTILYGQNSFPSFLYLI